MIVAFIQGDWGKKKTTEKESSPTLHAKRWKSRREEKDGQPYTDREGKIGLKRGLDHWEKKGISRFNLIASKMPARQEEKTLSHQ